MIDMKIRGCKTIIQLLLVMLMLELLMGFSIMYRVNAPEVKTGSLGSVIQDNKYLQAALPTDNGYYLFSEVGAGVKPLVLVGTAAEIIGFLKDPKRVGIDNRIKELPDIYASIVPYVPGERFVGLFPFHETVKQLIKHVTDLPAVVASPALLSQNLVGVVRDFVAYLFDRKELREKNKLIRKAQKKGKETVYYMKFSYLQELGMQKIGTHRIDFKALLQDSA